MYLYVVSAVQGLCKFNINENQEKILPEIVNVYVSMYAHNRLCKAESKQRI